MLSAPRMAQMNRLLDEALDLDAQGRRRWLEALSPEYEDLKPALQQALLPDTAAAEPGNLATLPKLGAADGATEAGSGLQAGELVGPYRLVRPLGAGGMAEVWLAQRADGAFKREVALKLPMLSRLRRDLASRFARERDMLAGLEHPNIARLYDAGVSAEGLPYLAMEYVHGEPLTAWCNRHRLGIRERLKLFLQVLDAVQYAHGHQVIHRDIKPSNILVTDSGQVRLLDFGVAKLLENPEETALTQVYGRALTPEYASPELARGEAVEAASDIYALGVVLYELLAGSRPYVVKTSASVQLLEQAIAAADVPPPSTQVGKDAGTVRSTTQEQLSRELRGDLDAIVLKALAKRPEDRYGSAEALADELQHYLSNEPVQAREDTPAYRLGKFVLRHRAGVAISAAVAVLMAGNYALTHRPQAALSPESSKAPIPAPAHATAVPDDKSIAVLPFVDMSEKHDQEYFSDGLTEELIDRLSHSPDLRVIARTSSFAFKGKNEDIRSIAGKLSVAHLLEGSVRKSGNALRITAQLIRAGDGTHLWSQTYERKVGDVFKVQADIAGTVAQALDVAVDANPIREMDALNPEAHTLYLKGNFFYTRSNKGDNERAIEAYKQAIKLDSAYSLAWAQLARVYYWEGVSGELPLAEARSKAWDAIHRALSINPNSARAHRVLQLILAVLDWDFPGAKSEAERTIALDPSGDDGLESRTYLYAMTAMITGRFDELLRVELQNIKRHPLDQIELYQLGGDEFGAGYYVESAATYRALLDLNSSYVGAWSSYGQALLFSGKIPEALAATEKEPDESNKLSGLAVIYWASGRRTESDAALDQLRKMHATTDAMSVADAYAYRGESDAAFEWLDQAYRQHDPLLINLKIDVYAKNLRQDPRYQAMLVKLKLGATQQAL